MQEPSGSLPCLFSKSCSAEPIGAHTRASQSLSSQTQLCFAPQDARKVAYRNRLILLRRAKWCAHQSLSEPELTNSAVLCPSGCSQDRIGIGRYSWWMCHCKRFFWSSAAIHWDWNCWGEWLYLVWETSRLVVDLRKWGQAISMQACTWRCTGG